MKETAVKTTKDIAVIDGLANNRIDNRIPKSY